MNETPNNPSHNQFNVAMRALAEADAPHEAAPHVEAALITAFRQQHIEEMKASRPVRKSFFARWQPTWRYALAAAALVFAGFSWWYWQAAQVVPQQNDVVAAPSPTPVPTPMNQPAPIEKISPPSVQLVAQRKSEPRRAKPGNQEAPLVEEEIATEFFPLVTQDALPERGQLHRVKVPRSTLVNFGLPVNIERLEIPINADLLVGEDGAARAIRFVQDRFPSETFINNGDGKPISAAYRKR